MKYLILGLFLVGCRNELTISRPIIFIPIEAYESVDDRLRQSQIIKDEWDNFDTYDVWNNEWRMFSGKSVCLKYRARWSYFKDSNGDEAGVVTALEIHEIIKIYDLPYNPDFPVEEHRKCTDLEDKR